MQDIFNLIVEKLKNVGAKNISAYDTQTKNNLTKYIILTSFENEEECKIVCNGILNLLSEMHIQPYNLEGLNKGSWIVIDLKDIILHILSVKEREKYNLEKLYKNYKKIL